jgi:hypothetical protein
MLISSSFTFPSLSTMVGQLFSFFFLHLMHLVWMQAPTMQVFGQKSVSTLLCKHFLGLFSSPVLNPSLTSSSLAGSAATYARGTPEGDLPASIVIAWYLFGVFVHQTSSGFVHWSSLVFAIIALLWVVDGVVIFSRSSVSLPDNENV